MIQVQLVNSLKKHWHANTMKNISGKIAVVAAGSSGIGKGIARVLSKEGCRVIIFSRDSVKLSDAAVEIENETKNQVSYCKADLRDRRDLERLMDFVHESLGKIDFLIMNYGDPKLAPFEDLTDADWDENIAMFLRSTIYLTKASLKDMRERGGRIVFVTSMTTKMGIENFSISGSLRSALVNLAKVVSLEKASMGITVNSISQGYVLTDRVRNIARSRSEKGGITYEEALNGIMRSIPVKRFAAPEEIGSLVAYLCSDDASYITGTNIQIDGGYVRFPF